MARVAFPLSRRVGVLFYLVVGSIFLLFWKPDLLSQYAWGLILAADGVVLLLGLVRPALRMRGLLKNGSPAQGTMWMLPAAVGSLFGLGLLVAGIIAILPE